MGQSERLSSYNKRFENYLSRATSDGVVERIWSRDAALWKEEEEHQKVIRNSLGWLEAPESMRPHLKDLKAFSDEIRRDGFTHLLLLGMGGSSLCVEVFKRTFGQLEGYPRLLVLDSTDPDTIKALENEGDLTSTLFIVSSKSGTTIEPLSFFRYFFERVRRVRKSDAGQSFIAITDPGAYLAGLAQENGFRRVFLNRPDIGGRFSALSYFGMLPAVLAGIDIEQLLSRAVTAAETCRQTFASENRALRLGCLMAACAEAGVDKLTLLIDEPIASLGLWIEQLVAESTGKEGKGIVPILCDEKDLTSTRADDRLCVRISLNDDPGTELQQTDAPLIVRHLDDPLDLAAEFFEWEFATAVAGALMKINPFDQPDVQAAKDMTNRMLTRFEQSRRLDQEQPLADSDGLRLYWEFPGNSTDREAVRDVGTALSTFFSQVKHGDYIALLAFIQETPEHDDLLGRLASKLEEALQVAATKGYGPRYLHSTGQLHKGGANKGVFVVLTDEDNIDLEIPDQPYSFSILKQAQALGDFEALKSADRRVARIHLGKSAVAGLGSLHRIVDSETFRRNFSFIRTNPTE